MNYEMIILVIGFIVIILSVFLAMFITRKVRDLYIHRQMIAVDPFNKFNYPPGFDHRYSEEPDIIRIMFFGDSRASQWPAPTMGERYQFQNRGIGGQTTAQILGRFNDHVVPLGPKFIVLQLGINDIKTVSLSPNYSNHIIQGCKDNIRQIVEMCEQQGYHTILTTIFPTGKAPFIRKILFSDRLTQHIEEINSFLLKLKSPNLTVLDAYNLLANGNGMVHKEYQASFVHINRSGYNVLNNQLMHILNGECPRIHD